MGKTTAKKGYKVRGKKTNGEPSVADEVEVSEFSTAEENAAGGALEHRTQVEDTTGGVSVRVPMMKSRKTMRKLRGRPSHNVMPSGTIPGAPEEVDLASGEQRRAQINRSDGVAPTNAESGLGAMQRTTIDARHTGAKRGAKRADKRGEGC